MHATYTCAFELPHQQSLKMCHKERKRFSYLQSKNNMLRIQSSTWITNLWHACLGLLMCKGTRAIKNKIEINKSSPLNQGQNDWYTVVKDICIGNAMVSNRSCSHLKLQSRISQNLESTCIFIVRNPSNSLSIPRVDRISN